MKQTSNQITQKDKEFPSYKEKEKYSRGITTCKYIHTKHQPIISHKVNNMDMEANNISDNG
jgi:hypothetical protein